MDPSRETLWNIEYAWIFYILAVLSILVFIYAIYSHYCRWRIGQPAGRFSQLGKRSIAVGRDTSSSMVEPLSERELEVLRLIVDGKSNREIAEALFIVAGTVKTHINNIYGKLGVQRRSQAIAQARELKLV